ncbi:MAG: hypothetical protein JXR77_09880 [Lentisphaeria bacterium]|nr:hypothetical protein [Lentisphaeria bacterium]
MQQAAKTRATAALVCVAVGCCGCLFAQPVSIHDYFPLFPESTWILADVDGDPADDEGFAWAVQGSGPQSVGGHTAWVTETDAAVSTNPAHGDRRFWNRFQGGERLGCYGFYEKAGALPLAANQTVGFSQPVLLGTDGMEVGWQHTTTASATLQIGFGVFVIPVPVTVTGAVELVRRLDELDTPMGTFRDVLVLTVHVRATATGIDLELWRETLFLARGVGLVRYAAGPDPWSSQAQAICGGTLDGRPISTDPGAEPAIRLTPDTTTTDEGGRTATIRIELAAPPTHPVTVLLASDTPTEGALTPPEHPGSFHFDLPAWDQPHTALVTGVDDSAWDGHREYHITVAIVSDDPLYAAIDPALLTLTFLNRDNETIDIEDHFVLRPGTHWRYERFHEVTGPVPDPPFFTWVIEDLPQWVHGAQAARLRTDLEDTENPLHGLVNFWSLDADGQLLLHGIHIPSDITRDVDYLGTIFTVTVPAQDIVFGTALLAGTRGMAVHDILHTETTADVTVHGLPFISSLPVEIRAETEFLGLRSRKRTPLGAFLDVPCLAFSLSIEAMGESLQDQGGVWFLGREVGVVCQNPLEAPEDPEGMALSEGLLDGNAMAAEDPGDRFARVALHLDDGWNLVAIPVVPVDPSPMAVFGAVTTATVWHVDRAASRPAAFIEAGNAYWVRVDSPAGTAARAAALTVEGFPPLQPERALTRGWVPAGVASAEAPLPLPLPAVDSGRVACRIAWEWNGHAYCPVQALTPGRGAWLFVERAATVRLAPNPPVLPE